MREEADDGDEEQFKNKISCKVMNSLYAFHFTDGNDLLSAA